MIYDDFLKENIKEGMSFEEIVSVFKEMHKLPVDDDDEASFIESGTCEDYFYKVDLFFVQLVRQFSNGDGEYYQTTVELLYEPDEINSDINDDYWSDESDADFFEEIKKLEVYEYAKTHKYKYIRISTQES